MNYKFILRTDQQRNGHIPLYCRGIFDRKKKDISLKIYLRKGQFDEDKNIVINHPDQVTLNFIIEKIKFKLNQELYNCQINEIPFSPELFEQIIKGRTVNRNSFYEFAMNEITNSPEFAKESVRTYTSQITKLKIFKPELTWKELTYEFIEKYKAYMINTLGNKENTYFKSLSFIKSIIYRAMKKDMVKENIFKHITLKKVPGKRDFLDMDELKKLEDLFSSAKLNKYYQNVLHYFLFCCYTGLRYYDVKTLCHYHIHNNVLSITMHKTQDLVRIPIIAKARALMVAGEEDQRIFKVVSNQKTNENLKAIMKIAGIKKIISFHCARHTFATVGLTIGIPMEVISKLLGHKDLKTTQIYAKVIDTLKIKEMEKWDRIPG